MTDLRPEDLERLREICGALPETYEEPAWIGTRWRVRKRTFAHVVLVEAGSDGAFARVAGSDAENTVLTFRAPADEVDALTNSGHPYFYAGWGRNVLGMVIEDGTDWNEVAELLTESFCMLAPAKLVARVDRPGV